MTSFIKTAALLLCFALLFADCTATASSCKCMIKSGRNGSRLLACTGSNGAQAYAYATGLITRNTNRCIRRTWYLKITDSRAAFGLCAPCASGAEANACVKYARDVIQDWCAAKFPMMDHPRCKCTAKSRGVGKSTVSCRTVGGKVEKIQLDGLGRNAKKMRACVKRIIPKAAETVYCRPCTHAARARSCATFIKFTAKALC